MENIFVQIASYRDKELIKTLDDLISKSKKPKNLKICIAHQYCTDDVFHKDIDKYRDDCRFKIIDIPYTEAKGVCWARNRIQQEYNGEKYTLQLDSHHRFIDNWDYHLIKDFKNLQKRYKKPLITGYIPHYDVDTGEKQNEVWKMNFDRISPDGNVHFMPSAIEEDYYEPFPARFYSAHFAFTIGKFAVEVQHDPEYYFHGEEISIAVRAYTSGYNLFHPHRIYAWHFYTRKNYKKHWDDHTNATNLINSSHAKNRKLFSMDGEVYEERLFGKYGFGKVRTLQDYERYAGISFSKRAVQQHTLDKKNPPNPYVKDYDNSFSNYFKHCIDIHRSNLENKNVTLIVVAFFNEEGKEIHRKDLTDESLKSVLSQTNEWYNIWIEFNSVGRPHKWKVLPYSESKGWLESIEAELYTKKNTERIFIHLPAYREPELLKTIDSALENAEYPNRLVFGICRQYNPEDGFDNVDHLRGNKQFKIKDILYTEAKGLAYARGVINDELLDDEEFVLQLDSHHRFDKNWDTTLLTWYKDLVKDGYNPLICGYLPYYNPFNDPEDRVQEPWLTEAASFYPHGTIFIRPTGVPNWRELTKPYPARFLSGHFAFGPNKWAKDIRHDPNIFFAGEELNLTVRSFTHGYDLFHPHRVIIWHATMRTERDGKLVWDDQNKRGDSMWWKQTEVGRSRVRQLIGVSDEGHDLTGYDLGTVRTIRDYEKYAGIHFKNKSLQKYTKENKFPPNPIIEDEKEWEDSFMYSFYYLVNITRDMLPGVYTSVLVAFDDENGIGVESEFIDDYRLDNFINNSTPIHYEKMFLIDKPPTKVVYWGLNGSEWKERVEIKL